MGVRYGRLEALRDVELTVEAGERVALVGPSGAGKTTLLSLLTGGRTPDRGRVLLFGRDPSGLRPRELRRLQRRIGTVHQDLRLVDALRVIHNVNAGRLGQWSTLRAVCSLLRPREVEEARRILALLGLEGIECERTGRLSGGERQRVALARVLAQDPELILADEPIASLDRGHARRIMKLLADRCREGDRSLVVSLHAWRHALEHCQRVVGLRRGRVLFDLPAARVTEAEMEALYRLEP